MATFQIRGHIYDAVTYNAYAGATVRIILGSSNPNFKTIETDLLATSAEDGSYIISGDVEWINTSPEFFFLSVTADNINPAESEHVSLSGTANQFYESDIYVILNSSNNLYKVFGRIAAKNGTPVTNLPVQVWDKSLNANLLLGESALDSQGYYLITFNYPPAGSQKLVPDIFVKVLTGYSPPQEYIVSPLFLAIDHEIEINLTPDEDYVGESDYVKFYRQVSKNTEFTGSFLEGTTTQRIEAIKALLPQEYAYLSTKVGLEYETLYYLIKSLYYYYAAGLSIDLQKELIYGILAYFKDDSISIYGKTNNELKLAINKATEGNIISVYDENDIDIFVSVFKEGLTDYLSSQTDADLYQLFLATGVDTVEARKAILETYLSQIEANGTQSNDFIAELRNKIGNPTSLTTSIVNKVEFYIQLMGVTGSGAITRALFTEGVLSLDNLVSMSEGFWSAFSDNHQELISNEGYDINQYVGGVINNINSAYPEKVLVRKIIDGTGLGSEKLVGFLDMNSAFPIFSDHVETLFENPNLNLTDLTPADIDDIKSEISKVQRLNSISLSDDRYNCIKTMANMGYSYALEIADLSPENFIEAFASEFTGNAEIAAKSAEYIYNASVLQSLVHLNTWANYASELNAISTNFVPNYVNTIPVATSPMPTFTDLFGGNDFCSCKSGRSVLSPAAYLADLLNSKIVDGSVSVAVAQKIISRRPDLVKIKLNEKNALTQIPYIDIVIELLANAIQNNSVEAFNTTLDADTIEALPENLELLNTGIETLAYKEYPWKLYFLYWLEEYRLWYKKLGLSRYKIMEVFPYYHPGIIVRNPLRSGIEEYFDTVYDGSYRYFEEKELAREYLGINYHEMASLFNGGTINIPNVYNVNSNRVPDLNKVRSKDDDISFLEKSKLTYDELLMLLSSYYVNPGNDSARIAIVLGTKPIGGKDIEDCDLNKAYLKYINGTVISDLTVDQLNGFLRRSYRYYRLYKNLNLTVPELDFLIESCGYNSINWNDDFLLRIYRIMKLSNELNLSLENTILLFSPFYTSNYSNVTKLYDKLFQSKSYDSTNEDQLKLTNTTSLGSNAACEIISAAIGITEEEYYYLLGKENLMSGSSIITYSNATVANLTLIYRVVIFCRAVNIGFADYYKLVKVNNDVFPISRKNAPTNGTQFDSIANTFAFNEIWKNLQQSSITVNEIYTLLGNTSTSALETISPVESLSELVISIGKKLYAERESQRMKLILDNASQKRIVLSYLEVIFPESDPDYSEKRTQVLGLIEGAYNNITILPSYIGVAFPEEDSVSYLKDPAHNLFDRYTLAINSWYQVSGNNIDLEKKLAVESYLRTFLTKEDVQTAMNLISLYQYTSSVAHDEQCAFIRAKFQKFIDPDEAIMHLVPPTEIIPQNNTEFYKENNKRFNFILFSILNKLLTDLVINEISIAFSINNQLSSNLLQKWITINVSNEIKGSITEFISDDFIDKFAPGNSGPLTDQYNILIRLIKALYFINKYQLSEDVCQFIKDHHEDLKWKKGSTIHILDIFGLPALPYSELEYEDLGGNLNRGPIPEPYNFGDNLNEWLALYEAWRLNLSFARSPYSLFSIWKLACEDPSNTGDVMPIIELLSITTGWNKDIARFLLINTEGFIHTADYRHVRWVKNLANQFYISSVAGIMPKSIIDINKTDLSIEASAVMTLRSLIKRKFNYSQWLQIAKSVLDPMRIMLRDALVEYLMSYGFNNQTFTSVESLYDYFLIDPLMSPCAKTSRIVQATLSVQLFVQRILLNLESGLSLNTDQKAQWEWKKNYRVWEACRKIFLYPENWLEPEWRTGKTEQFKKLEDAIQQNDITTENAEQAFKDYVVEVEELSNLEIASIFREGNSPTSIDKVHFLGRTVSLPHIYYYRKLDLTQSPSNWSPWEKIDVDIEGDFVTIAANGEDLIILWPIQNQVGNKSSTVEEKYIKDQYRIGFIRKQGIHWNKKIVSEIYFSTLYSPVFIDIKSFINGKITFNIVDKLIFKGNTKIATNKGEIGKDNNILIEPIPYGDGDGNQYNDFTYSAGKNILKTDVSETKIPSIYQQSRLIKNLKKGDTLVYSNMHFYYPQEEQIESYFINYRNVIPVIYKNQKAIWYAIPRYNVAISDPNDPIDKSVNTVFKTNTSIKSTHPGNMGLSGKYYSKNTSNQIINNKSLITINTDTTSDKVVKPPVYYGNLYYDVYTLNSLFLPDFRKKVINSGIFKLFENENSNGFNFFRQANTYKILKDSTSTNLIELGADAKVIDNKTNHEIDFNRKYPFTLYNWELFFHIPVYVADQLSTNKKFAEAQKWYHTIFDPTQQSILTDKRSIQRVWKLKPFYESAGTLPENIREILHSKLSSYNLIQPWLNNPTDAHAVAAMRITSYMRNIVMKYLDNLIAWGDYLYAQDTLESLNEATQLYILASEILGPRPEIIEINLPLEKNYSELIAGGLDTFSNNLFTIEATTIGIRGPEMLEEVKTDKRATLPVAKEVVRYSLYFGVPYNEKLLGYWDTVSDRLFKLRNCMNLKGIVRQLPLFSPPIDPALLVQATAAGLDLSEIIAGLNQPMNPYRYRIMIQKARELVSEVAALGGSLLAALEKIDAEELTMIRASHEITLLKLVKLIKTQAINESAISIEVLEANLSNTQQRLSFYKDRNPLTKKEKDQMKFMVLSNLFQTNAGIMQTLASVLGIMPQIHATLSPGAEIGGTQLRVPADVASQVFNMIASAFLLQSQLSSIKAGYERRQEEWNFQVDQASGEIKSLEKQIAASKIRMAIAEQELANHELQMDQSDEYYEFLKTKFTNKELYSWMVKEISSLYFSTYKMAVDYARQAEKAFYFETSVKPTESIIGYGHWDNLKSGLLAGERLRTELNLLDKAYTESNTRTLEITKHFSLAMFDPAKLNELRTSGSCEVTIPDFVFDLDYPGQYLRRIKSVALSIPAVTAPNTNVSCRLTLLSSHYRYDPACDGTFADYLPKDPDDRFVFNPVASQSIATSSAQNDKGLFEFSFNDERYLPFEGAGATSTWKLELPADFRQFDYLTIADAILHINYTALDAGGNLAVAAKDYLNTLATGGLGVDNLLAQVIEWKAEFADELYQLQSTGTTSFLIKPDMFPQFTQDYCAKNNKVIKLSNLTFLIKGSVTEIGLNIGSSGFSIDLVEMVAGTGIYSGSISPDISLSDLGTLITLYTGDNASLENIIMVLEYKCQ